MTPRSALLIALAALCAGAAPAHAARALYDFNPGWKLAVGDPADAARPGFDDSAWKTGPSGFGALDTRFARVGTEWKTADIWLRRTVDLPETRRTHERSNQ